LDSALADVGYGKLDPEKLARKLLNLPLDSELEKKKRKKKKESYLSGIRIDGIDNLMVSIAECCRPLPGDDVVGIVNSGKGIVIHLKNCLVAKQVMESAPGKVLKVEFLPSQTIYKAKVRISVEDTPGVLANVSTTIAKHNINIADINTRKSQAGKTILDLVLDVKSKEELQKVLSSLRTVKGVITAKRVKREKLAKSE